MAVLSSFYNGNELFLMFFRHCHTTYPNVVLKNYADIVWQCLTLKCFAIQGIFIFLQEKHEGHFSVTKIEELEKLNEECNYISLAVTNCK